MRGFILITAPTGGPATPENMVMAPVLAESSEKFLADFNPGEMTVVGLTPLELLIDQIHMINDLAAQHGVTLDVN